jgi:ferrous-iron efflux pump FieF
VSDSEDRDAGKRLPAAEIRLMRLAGAASVGVACVLIAIKSWAWLATDSVSLLGSLADSLLDLVASLITFYAVRVAVEPADREHRFGHGKSEAVAALLQSVIVTGSAFYVGFEAVTRLLAPERIAAPAVGLGVIAVSVLLTVALIGFQRHVVRRTRSLSIAADSVHYRADVVTNLAVIVAIVLNYYFEWYAADPVLGLLIAAVILASVRTIAMQALDVLLDRELPGETQATIRSIALSHPAVRGVHDIRTRSAGHSQFIQLHLELEPELTLIDAHVICDTVQTAVRSRYPRAEVIIHADPDGVPDARDLF